MNITKQVQICMRLIILGRVHTRFLGIIYTMIGNYFTGQFLLRIYNLAVTLALTEILSNGRNVMLLCSAVSREF